jgi:hypothetical protein
MDASTPNLNMNQMHAAEELQVHKSVSRFTKSNKFAS